MKVQVELTREEREKIIIVRVYVCAYIVLGWRNFWFSSSERG